MLLSTLSQVIFSSIGTQATSGDLANTFAGIGIFSIVIGLSFFIFTLWMYVRILNKLGYSGWWVALIFVPFGVFVGIILLAFKEAPVESELKHLRHQVRGTGSGGNIMASSPQYQSPYGNYGQQRY